LKKAGMIAIDRSTPERALRSIQNGAVRVKEQGRPILIFPQGTRVGVDEMADWKPYRPGVARIQEVTQLPVIPVALNSGVFWPRNSWLKSSGTVIIQIMEPVAPGKERHELMSELEQTIENQSNVLVAEARKLKHTRQSPVRGEFLLAFTLLALAGIYTYWWGV